MQPSTSDLVHVLSKAIANARADDQGALPPALADDIALGLRIAAALLERPGTGAADLDLQPHVAPAGPSAFSPPRADDRAFQTYLREMTGDAGLRLLSVEQLSGGFSRETFRLQCDTRAGAHRFVLRREVPDGLLDGIGIGVANEFPLMRVAELAGVPMPAPHWIETDPAVLGQPFLVMDCAAGRCLGTSLGADQPMTLAQPQALAAMLAALHRADAATVASWADIAHDSATAAAALLDRWEDYWRASRAMRAPELERALDWLRAHLPENGARPCLTHGDVGFHNIMADGERFTALLDWEMAVIASPVKDLAHVRPSIEPLIDWTAFLGFYRDAGGAMPDPLELRWFELFRAFSMALVCCAALAKLANPHLARLEYLRLAFIARPVFLGQINQILDPEEAR